MAGKHGIVSTCFNHINHKYHNHPQKNDPSSTRVSASRPLGSTWCGITSRHSWSALKWTFPAGSAMGHGTGVTRATAPGGQWPGKKWANNTGKSWEHHGNHGQNMEKHLQNHGKTLQNHGENGKTIVKYGKTVNYKCYIIQIWYIEYHKGKISWICSSPIWFKPIY